MVACTAIPPHITFLSRIVRSVTNLPDKSLLFSRALRSWEEQGGKANIQPLTCMRRAYFSAAAEGPVRSSGRLSPSLGISHGSAAAVLVNFHKQRD